MRPYLEEACEQVDASVFSGELLYDYDERNELKAYVKRWDKAIADHEALIKTEETT